MPGTRSCKRAINSFDSSHGAPTFSKGEFVPRPSEKFVASSKQVPGYNSAVAGDVMFGEGETQGRPVSSNTISRRQPSIFITCKSALIVCGASFGPVLSQ